MPLVIEQLQPSCGFDSDGPRLWSYKTPDPIADVAAANYFDGAAGMTDNVSGNGVISGTGSLRQGDFIICHCDTDAAPGSTTVHILGISAVAPDSVTTTSAANALDLQ